MTSEKAKSLFFSALDAEGSHMQRESSAASAAYAAIGSRKVEVVFRPKGDEYVDIFTKSSGIDNCPSMLTSIKLSSAKDEQISDIAKAYAKFCLREVAKTSQS